MASLYVALSPVSARIFVWWKRNWGSTARIAKAATTWKIAPHGDRGRREAAIRLC
jgi:hypothetical protein